MKKLLLTIILPAVLVLCACHSNHYYDELPRPIAEFLSSYWADPDIESYSQPSADRYIVIIKNGPSLIFNGDYLWTEIDGNGLPLPQIVLYDQLPTDLYDYIESGSQLNQVFSLSRDPREYRVSLLDSNLVYDIQTRTVRTVESPADAA